MSYYSYPRGTCSRPDPGWNCSGDEGHDGPCASWPDDPRLDPSYEEIEDSYVFGLVVAVVLVVALLCLGALVGLVVALVVK